MAQCLDIEEIPKEEMNGAFPIPSIKRCLEAGRRQDEGVCGKVYRSKSLSVEC